MSIPENKYFKRSQFPLSSKQSRSTAGQVRRFLAARLWEGLAIGFSGLSQDNRTVAFVAGLSGFELEDGLDELAVKVAFVADDPSHWVFGREEALAD
jgi:hypothetical protein